LSFTHKWENGDEGRVRSAKRRAVRAAIPVTAVTGLLAFSALAAGGAGTVAASASGRLPAPVPATGTPAFHKLALPAPITTTACQTELGINCYTPLQYRVAYDLNPLYSRGITGKGRTIVIVDSFGSPTIQSDLHTFDTQFGLPDPVLQIEKFGNVPPFDPNNSDMISWAGETTLDVEYAHAVAPGAKIVLAETPVAETEGTTGLPEMMNAEQSLINSGVGDVISQSFGATENTFPGSAPVTSPACWTCVTPSRTPWPTTSPCWPPQVTTARPMPKPTGPRCTRCG
jgi:hypothetical protein